MLELYAYLRVGQVPGMLLYSMVGHIHAESDSRRVGYEYALLPGSALLWGIALRVLQGKLSHIFFLSHLIFL